MQAPKYISFEEASQNLTSYHILDCTCCMDGSWDPRTKFENDGHLPGAHYLNIRELSDKNSQLPFTMPTKEQLKAHLGGLGIGMSKPILCYDSTMGMFANRGAFILASFGFQQVWILDGVLPAWQAAGYQVETGEQQSPAQDEDDYSGLFDQPVSVITYDRVKQASEDQSVQIIDTRPAHMFQNGSIPSSLSMPATAGGPFINEEGKMRSAEEIRAAFEDQQVDLAKPMAFSCGGGIMACIGFNAAKRAGLEGEAFMFDGSFAEWKSNNPQ